MKEHRIAILRKLDDRAKGIALDLTRGHRVTPAILATISDLYESAKVENAPEFGDGFETAYHTAITGELEFFIARIMYNYGREMGSNWSIYLRRQVKGPDDKYCAPDIRVRHGSRDIAIIEIKSKGGWMQPFFSLERYKKDVQKHDAGHGHPFNPNSIIERERTKIQRAISTFNLRREDVFFVLPTLTGVHKVKYKREVRDYYGYFEETSTLSQNNFILLSENLRLDLSGGYAEAGSLPTDRFETMVNRIAANQ